MIVIDTAAMIAKVGKHTDKMTRMQARMRDLTPILKHIANDVLVVADDSFVTETSPSGKRWKPLAPSTIAKRKGRGRGILHLTGKLRGGMRATVLPGNRIRITNLAGYLDPHQRGDQKRRPPRPPQRAVLPFHALGGGTYSAMTSGRGLAWRKKTQARIKRFIQRGLGAQGQGSTRGA